MSTEDRPQLDQVIQWAKEAGEIARSGFRATHDVAYKGKTDLVTEIDFQVEKHLIESIQTAFPAHSILAEESGAVNGKDGERWYIDPLDGTIYYAHRIPFYAVSIAWERDGDLQLGVVYDPTHDECFYAERGKGAWLNGEPLRVSQTVELEKSLNTTAFVRQDAAVFERNVRLFAHLSRHTFGVRRMGCASLELSYISCGRMDAYWEQGINAWDIAAAALIVEEAGGKVTALDGSPEYFKPPYALLASAPGIHAQLVSLFQQLK